jgi:hypothetical protein
MNGVSGVIAQERGEDHKNNTARYLGDNEKRESLTSRLL